MKTLRHASILGLLCALCAIALRAEPAPATARETRFIIGLSPFLQKEVKDDVFRRITGFLLEDLPLNSSLSLYDAYHLRTIADLHLPDARPFKSGKTRANQFKDHIHKLREFLATDHPRPETSLPLDSAIRFPQFLDFIAEHHRPGSSGITVILLGSPLYMDHREPGFSMVNGYFPSDGHLLATREQSIYGLQSRPPLMEGVQLHFGYFGDPWINELHRDKISRFWALYLQEQRAHLGAFTADLSTLFKAAVAPPKLSAQRTISPELDRAQTKPEMLRISRDIGVGDWITRDLPAGHQQRPPSKTVGPLKIGIRWQGNIDLDLYASAQPHAQTLFFENPRSPEGYYFKDHRSSPDREYEFIEFESPVDLFQVQARINFFEGALAASPAGEVRVEFDGRIYSAPFSIPAARGNKGRSGPSQSAFWTRIDVPAILGLRRPGDLVGGK